MMREFHNLEKQKETYFNLAVIKFDIKIHVLRYIVRSQKSNVCCGIYVIQQK